MKTKLVKESLDDNLKEDLIFDIVQSVESLINGDDVEYEPSEELNEKIEKSLRKINLSMDDLNDEDVLNQIPINILLKVKKILVNYGVMND